MHAHSKSDLLGKKSESGSENVDQDPYSKALFVSYILGYIIGRIQFKFNLLHIFYDPQQFFTAAQT